MKIEDTTFVQASQCDLVAEEDPPYGIMWDQAVKTHTSHIGMRRRDKPKEGTTTRSKMS
jgi:hypothetical protein